MRFAFCLRGQTRGKQFSKSYKNIKTLLIDDLKQNNDVNVFINTYENEYNNILIDKLNPVNYHYNKEMNEDPYSYIIPTQIIQCCKQVKEQEKNTDISYDCIIITRFDLTFNTHYSNYNIDYNKINMECMFVPDYNSGDNFLLFHRKYLDLIIKCMELSIESKEFQASHKWWKIFEKNGLECHYIGGETNKRHPHYDIMFRFTRYVN